jgi:hypothetical protein
MANYRDFAIVQVENADVMTQRQWRERGNRSIFAETMQTKRRNKTALGLGLDSGLGNSGSASSLPGTWLCCCTMLAVTFSCELWVVGLCGSLMRVVRFFLAFSRTSASDAYQLLLLSCRAVMLYLQFSP